jgi:hypothetical protein
MGLETVEIVIDIEAHFGVAIPDEVVTKAVTVGDLHAGLVDLLVRNGRPRGAELEEEVYLEMVIVIAVRTGIDVSRIRSESRWVGEITEYG